MNRQTLLDLHATVKADSLYLLGFSFRGRVYAFFTDTLNKRWLRDDVTSHAKGASYKIRLDFDSFAKSALINSKKAIYIGDEKTVMTCTSYKNRGVNFECYCVKYFTGEKRDRQDGKSFDLAGDMQYNGAEVQIKFERAEIANERTTLNAIARAGL